MEIARPLLIGCVRSSSKLLFPHLKLIAYHPNKPLIVRNSTEARTADMELTPLHDQSKKEFYIQLQQGQDDKEKAMLQYEWVKNGVADLYHTEVPPVFRGRGVAKILAKAALDYFVEKDAQMILSCTYLQKYIKDNPLPEYTSRTVTDL